MGGYTALCFSKLPMRQLTNTANIMISKKISKLPMRQLTYFNSSWNFLYISKLPMRQLTWMYAVHVYFTGGSLSAIKIYL